MALSDERLKRMIRSVEEGEMDPDDMHEALLELLAIRERQASADAGTAPDAFTDAMERAVLGLPPPAPERRYSEEEVLALLNALNEQMRPGDYIDIEAAMRRLRGEGEAK